MSEAAKVVDERSSEIQKLFAQRYNLRSSRKDFSVGDQIFVMQSEGSSKLQPKWQGPVVVKEKTRIDSYVIVDEAGAERENAAMSPEASETELHRFMKSLASPDPVVSRCADASLTGNDVSGLMYHVMRAVLGHEAGVLPVTRRSPY
ncbi:hypothetical protein MRX96_043116 [Rhipicephalus microplus]